MSSRPRARTGKKSAPEKKPDLTLLAPAPGEPPKSPGEVQWVHSVARKYDEVNFRQLYQQLKQEKEIAAKALQAKVFDNYSVFIDTSKEISNLESDVARIRSMLQDYKFNLESLKQVELKKEASKRERRRRSVQLQQALVAETLGGNQKELFIDLEALVAQQQLKQAVHLLETIEPRNETEQASLSAIRQEVAALLVRKLSNPALGPVQLRETIELLIQLGLADTAKTLFLASRSENTRQSLKRFALEPDTKTYVTEVSKAVANAISRTYDDYNRAFKDPKLLSAFVLWALAETRHYCALIKARIFFSNDFALIGDALTIVNSFAELVTFLQETNIQLDKRGLSLTVSINQELSVGVKDAITSQTKKLEVGLAKKIEEERWEGVEHPESKTLLFTSCLFLEQELKALLKELSLLFSPMTIPAILQAIEKFCSSYVNQLTKRILGQEKKDSELLLFLNNAIYLSKGGLNSILSDMGDVNAHRIHRGIRKRVAALRDSLCIRRSEYSVNKILQWSRSDYSQSKISSPEQPSDNFLEFARDYVNFKTEAKSRLSSGSDKLAAQYLLEVGVKLADIHPPALADDEAFGKGGIHQFLIDIEFFLALSGEQTEVASIIKELSGAALKAFSKSEKVPKSEVLKPRDWYQKIVKKAMAEFQ